MRLHSILRVLILAAVGVFALFVAGLAIAPLPMLILLEELFPTAPTYEISRRFVGPTGLHKVVLLRRTNTPFIFPGQGSDAPGHLCLVDTKGQILAGEPVDMVQLVDRIEWQSGHARVWGVVDWDLADLQMAAERKPARAAAALRRPGGTRNVASENKSLCRNELRP